jgi:hypothetical protein
MVTITHDKPNHTAAVKRDCDICGKPFFSKNREAARMMLTGRLRVCDDCRRAGARTTLPYNEYLKTDWWLHRRERALKLAEHCCQVCNASGRLEVHHRTYERLGHERDADLIVLCADCHRLFHSDGRMPY